MESMLIEEALDVGEQDALQFVGVSWDVVSERLYLDGGKRRLGYGIDAPMSVKIQDLALRPRWECPEAS